MEKITIGIDPDSDRMGFSVYVGAELVVCATATIVEIITGHLPEYLAVGDVVFSIENVMANKFVYARNQKQSKSAQSTVAMAVGRCQQNQIELMRWLDHYGVPYMLHKPQRGNWAKNKELFEKITGWKGRSNPDSRAAAFFGFLQLKSGL